MTVSNGGEPPDSPLVGIVVVVHNGLNYTADCLRSLAAVDYQPTVVVLVDNGSTDETVAVLRSEHPEVELLEMGDNTGFTGGNNAGIRWCLERGCEAVLLLNNDTHVPPDFLGCMVDRLDGDSIVAPEIRSAEPPQAVQDRLGWFDWRRGVARPLHRPVLARAGQLPARIASGCCLLVPRKVFEQIGLLDERFFLYYEDVDFIVRAQLAGFRLVAEPSAVVYHHGRGSSDKRAISPATLYYNTRNRLYLMQKYSQASLSFIAYFTATRVLHSLRYLVRGDLGSVRSICRGVRDFATRRYSRADYRW